MEHNLPSVVNPEHFRQSEAKAKKKTRWNIFEAFKKREQVDSAPNEAPRTLRPGDEIQIGERTPEASTRRQRLGESILRLLRRDKHAPTEATSPQSSEHAPKVSPERSTPPTSSIVERTEPAEQTIVERAQEMGRGVLRLLKRVKSEVLAADRHEEAVRPTDVNPLDEADDQVRAAMRALIAPIEAYAAEQGIVPTTPEQPESQHEAASATNSTTQEQSAASVDVSGGDGDGDRMPRLFDRSAVADTVAAMTVAVAERLSDSAERRMVRRQRLGLFAVGAATVGVLVYTWYRQRELRKEQRALKREHQRFEKEVRDYQKEERERIERLEQVQVAKLTQAERQAHVREVSRFASAQAEAIHAVARQQEERVALRAAQPTIERPVIEQPHALPLSVPTPEHQAAGSFVMPLERRAEDNDYTDRLVPAEAPRRTLIDREVRGGEPRTLGERAMEALGRPKQAAANTGTGAGGGLLNRLLGMTPADELPATAPASPTDHSTPQTSPPPTRTNQEWLLGVGLAIGIAAVLLLLIKIL